MLLQKEISFELKGNTYSIKFPNVGQILDIEVLKSSLAKGFYSSMQATLNRDSQFALDVVDCQAYLTVLCPQLMKDLKVPFQELQIEEVIEIRSIFVDKILPFIKQWRDIIANIGKEKSDNE